MQNPSDEKLKWRCRRGMLELDLILSCFIEKRLQTLSVAERCLLEQLLQCPDPDLYAWFMGYESPVKREFLNLVAEIRIHGKP